MISTVALFNLDGALSPEAKGNPGEMSGPWLVDNNS